jgi:hypothetical protein
LNFTAELSSARASPLTSPRTSSLGRCSSSFARLAGGEHDPNPIRLETAGDERQRQHGGVIEPLRVVDDAQEGTLVGSLGEQAQHAQSDEKPVWGRSGAEPEHGLKRLALRRRKPR